MRDILNLRAFWQDHKDEKLALCTLVRKQGSSYRAVGAKKIVTLNGDACGLLSGGCLEAHIENTARQRWHEMPFIAQFNMLSETDRLLGYQTGCTGAIDILFEILPDNCNEMDLYLPFGQVVQAEGVAVSLAKDTLGQRHFAAQGMPGAFFDPWVTSITLFIIGCGADAPVFAELVPPLGWNLCFLDYRSDFNLPLNFAYRAKIFAVDEIAQQILPGKKTAVVIMTHNYEADMIIIAGLQDKILGYIGCLGPRKRYEQIKMDLEKMRGIIIPPDFENHIHAPAGIFSGRTPEEIALSIIAQIQMTLQP